ncbi:hypothetical protein DH2020_000783 [Rehmannia glutinosa]|uniref:Exonuclease domain-containing protein n=1 Tax=Rehmannia glutinosa TaxID=99300 RepID=A0ABR0XY33_REHGL
MDKLSNSFSLLELDSEDAKGESSIATAAADTCERQDDDKGIENGSEDGTLQKNENGDQQTWETTPTEYKMPLVWIDLEMTGLNIEVDRILEIACVITDGNLTKSIEVIEFVKRHVGTYTPLIAGNSIYMDLLFLRKYMPDLAALFSHVLVDVSSVKALCLRWYPRDKRKALERKTNTEHWMTSRKA